MSHVPVQISPAKYRKIRARQELAIADRIEIIKQSLSPEERLSFSCSFCGRHTPIRTATTELCLECYLATLPKGPCSRCKQMILMQLEGEGKCVNTNGCRAN